MSESSQHPLTSAEQLLDMQRLVKFTLWRMSTEPPEADGPFAHYSAVHIKLIQNFAEELFSNDIWVSKVVGSYAAQDRDVDLEAFEALIKPCTHDEYITLGHQNYPYVANLGPFCPTCNEVVEI